MIKMYRLLNKIHLYRDGSPSLLKGYYEGRGWHIKAQASQLQHLEATVRAHAKQSKSKQEVAFIDSSL